MYKISQLGKFAGLSRTTLLYYEKQGLIQGRRLKNGYRVYSDKDLQRLRLIQKLQAGGLTLKECQACLEEKVERAMLQHRLDQLDQEIAQKQKSRQLLAALLGEAPLTEWHESLDDVAPDAHIDWLKKQGFDDKQVERLRWLSKDLNQHEQYMTDFMAIFGELDRWGPSSSNDVANVVRQLPLKSLNILEIGCGNGLSTQWLAQNIDCHVTAVDNEASALEKLVKRAQEQKFEHLITPVCASMMALPFDAHCFDIIWAECSAYLIGVERAFREWQPLLKQGGIMVISDLVWSQKRISKSAQRFWSKEYPSMTTAQVRVEQAQKCGYQVLDSFTLSDTAWDNYYLPLAKRVSELESVLDGSQALANIRDEIDIYKNRNGEFDYQMLVLKLIDKP